MTRACMHMIHLDFSGAMEYNNMVFLVLPILCLLLLQDFIVTIKKIRNYGKEETEEVVKP